MQYFGGIMGNAHGIVPVKFTGEFPTQRPVTRSFVVFDLHLNKRLSKHSWGWWFETPSSPLWRHCNDKPGMRCLTTSRAAAVRGIHIELACGGCGFRLIQFVVLYKLGPFTTISNNCTSNMISIINISRSLNKRSVWAVYFVPFAMMHRACYRNLIILFH